MATSIFYQRGLPSGWWAAGQNDVGQLALGDATARVGLTRLAGDYAQIAGGDDHTVLLTRDGQVKAVGGNAFGQLGDNTVVNKTALVPMLASGVGGIAAISGIRGISAGRVFSVTLDNAGNVWGCGHADHSQFGLGYTDGSVPHGFLIKTLLGSGIAKVACGGYHTLALNLSGIVFVVGNNADGSAGIGTATPPITTWTSGLRSFNEPLGILEDLAPVLDIDGGDLHSLFLMQDGTVRACGKNTVGQIGLGFTNARRNSVSLVINLSGMVAISAGGSHNLALKGDGTVWAWGSNSVGQLGVGDTVDRSTPIQVSGLPAISGIRATQSSSYFKAANGMVYACGNNFFGELGNGVSGVSENSTPTLTFGNLEIDAFGDNSDSRFVHVYSDGLGDPGLDMYMRGAPILSPTTVETHRFAPVYKWFADAQAAIVGVLTTGKTVTIEVWKDGVATSIASAACAEIGDTGKYSWSIGNLQKLAKTREQYHWRMTDQDSNTDEGDFIIETIEPITAMPSLMDPSSYIVTH